MVVIGIRAGRESDVPDVLELLDRAGAWLIGQGRTGQWGTARQSTMPHRLAQAATWVATGLYVAESDGVPVGAMVLSDQPSWKAPPVDEPERYVRLLVSDPGRRGNAIGARLLEYAGAVARAGGVRLLRLDCYAGGDGRLVAYYERHGFTVAQRIDATRPDGQRWLGALLQRRLDP